MEQTIQEMRVAVARDALVQAESGRFVTGNCYFFRTQDYCGGCALGSLLLGAINCGAVKEPSEPDAANNLTNSLLRQIWTHNELGKIEFCFERSTEWDQAFPCSPRINGRRTMPFNVRRNRLIAILQNIIRNNGTFDPADIQPIESPAIPTTDFKTPVAAGQAVEALAGQGAM